MIKDPKEWAQQTFGGCQLGDQRRTERLIDVGARMAQQAGQSLAKCCAGDPAALVGSYRLLRNAEVQAQAIREGGFARSAEQARGHELLLAVEDTTSVSYSHSVACELGTTSNHPEAKQRGYLVHSVLLLNGQGSPVGLIEQHVWARAKDEFGKKHQRKHRAYEDKESYKWQRASERMSARMGSLMARTISVCDRESDIYDYLHYKCAQGQRFVVRSMENRRLQGRDQLLWSTLEHQAKTVGRATVEIPQRGGRKARRATVRLRRLEVELAPGRRQKGTSVQVRVVLAEETNAPTDSEPLRWILLTSEPVDEAWHVQEVVRYYTQRWRIEEFHKAWKSGVGVEQQRFQHADNLERMLAITAFIAVRLLQLRDDTTSGMQASADEPALLEGEVWKLLWISTEPKKPMPSTPPNASWMFGAIAKLGGFADTKRTGRPGWETVWHGWFRLQERLVGFELAMRSMGREM
jgi:hypothetical protein